jgi:hypothetical protein
LVAQKLLTVVGIGAIGFAIALIVEQILVDIELKLVVIVEWMPTVGDIVTIEMPIAVGLTVVATIVIEQTVDSIVEKELIASMLIMMQLVGTIMKLVDTIVKQFGKIENLVVEFVIVDRSIIAIIEIGQITTRLAIEMVLVVKITIVSILIVGWLVDIVVGMKELVLPKLIAKILMLVMTKKAVITVVGRPTIGGFVVIIASRFVLKPVGKLVEKLTGLAIAIGIEKIETRPILAIGDTIEESLVGSMVIVVVDIGCLAISRLIIVVVIDEHTEWKAVVVVDIAEMLTLAPKPIGVVGVEILILAPKPISVVIVVVVVEMQTVVPKPIVVEHSSESIKIEKEPIVGKLTTSRFAEIEKAVTPIELIAIVDIENELIISRFIGLVAIVIKVELIAIITKFMRILVGSLGVVVPRLIALVNFRLVSIVFEMVLGIVTEKQLAVVRHIISRSIAIVKQKLAIKQSIDIRLAIAITKMQLATKTRSMMARLIVTNSKSFELNLPTLKQMAIIIMNVELKPMIVDMKAAEIIAIIIITVIKKINGTIVRPIPALELTMIAELLMLIPILVHPTRRLVDAMIVALLLALILETNWKLAAPIVNRILHLRRLALQRLITDAMTMKLTLARIPVGIAEMLELVPILVRHRQQ